MEILTGEEMRRVDRDAIERLGIPSLLLMEMAGRGVAESLLADHPGAARQRVVILCGKGNNGGDGLVAARHLARLGVTPLVLVLARADALASDAATNLRTARDAGVDVREVDDEDGWRAAASLLDGAPIVVDALLGTGVRGGARGLVATAIESLNASRARVVSIDIPSGLDADAVTVPGVAVCAERTYTLCRPKLPLVIGAAAVHAGSWRVIPIGIPDAAVQAVHPTLEWLDAPALSGLLSPRAPDSHKGSYGHLLAVAGSRGKTGAAVLVARSALRCGVGLMTVAAPAACAPWIGAQQAEIMTEALPEAEPGVLGRAGGPAAAALLAERTALALGPGLGTAEETFAAVRALVATLAAPAVIDADGLNALAGQPRLLVGTTPRTRPLVLTPHPGEAARLLARATGEVQADRLAAARALARDSGAIVVLKGHRTLIATPDGHVAVNSTGNPGMATGGTGDALTGAVGAFLARGLSGWDAARLAVYVHGDAGDRAARERGEDGAIASDLIAELPRAITSLRDAARGSP